MQALNLKAVLLAVSLIGVSASAYANPALIGGDQNVSPNIEVYSFEHAGFTDNGNFDHWLSFNIDGFRTDFTATISGTTPAIGDTFKFFAFDLYDAENGSKLATGDVTNLTARLAFAGIETVNLAGPATYWLKISGNAVTSGDHMAIYTGNITTAVPEPSTYGMLALGLGLIGFAARGRSKFSA